MEKGKTKGDAWTYTFKPPSAPSGLPSSAEAPLRLHMHHILGKNITCAHGGCMGTTKCEGYTYTSADTRLHYCNTKPRSQVLVEPGYKAPTSPRTAVQWIERCQPTHVGADSAGNCSNSSLSIYSQLGGCPVHIRNCPVHTHAKTMTHYSSWPPKTDLSDSIV